MRALACYRSQFIEGRPTDAADPARRPARSGPLLGLGDRRAATASRSSDPRGSRVARSARFGVNSAVPRRGNSGKTHGLGGADGLDSARIDSRAELTCPPLSAISRYTCLDNPMADTVRTEEVACAARVQRPGVDQGQRTLRLRLRRRQPRAAARSVSRSGRRSGPELNWFDAAVLTQKAHEQAAVAPAAQDECLRPRF